MGCKSEGIRPKKDCSIYKKQALIFHPDKNVDCNDEATEKMKELLNYCPSGQTDKLNDTGINPLYSEITNKTHETMEQILKDLIENCNYELSDEDYNDITRYANGTFTNLDILNDKPLENSIEVLINLNHRINYENGELDESIDKKIPNINTIIKNLNFIKKTFNRQLKRETDGVKICMRQKILGYIDEYNSDIDRLLEGKTIKYTTIHTGSSKKSKRTKKKKRGGKGKDKSKSRSKSKGKGKSKRKKKLKKRR